LSERPRSPAATLGRLLRDRRLAFLLVGGFNVVQGVGWFALFHVWLGSRVDYGYVLMLAYVPAIAIGFVLYRTLVFKVEGHVAKDFGRFVLVQGAAYAINTVSLPFLHEIVHVELILAQAISVGVILAFNYVGHLYFSFRRSHGHPDAGRLLEPEAVHPGPAEDAWGAGETR